MPFYPSLGAGGHCIPVDPIYLSEKSREFGISLSMIEVADRVNRYIPLHFIGLAESKLKDLNGRKILIVGVSYKPNVSDVRETPVEALLMGLRKKGFEVFWHDDLVNEWLGEKSSALSNNYDLAIVATLHDYLDLSKLGDVPVLNTKNSKL
jgi:UDP-N-acetyl-D-glucosamine dehydrogenase